MLALEWAKDYLDHGYNIIPSLAKTKRPPFAWKEYQERRSTYAEVEGWFSQNPNWNLSVVCGDSNRLVVVDADDADSITFCNLHLTETPFKVQTRKGVHFYYRHPGGYVASRTRVHSVYPIDIRGDGGLATGLGSIHETGYVYQLYQDSDLVSILDLPVYNIEWFPIATPKAFNRMKVTAGPMEKAMRFIDKQERAGSGIRNQVAFKIAAALTHDFALTEDQAMSLLLTWNERNDPPLPEAEIKTIVKSSIHSARNPIGNWLH